METLELDLNQERAAYLIVLLDIAIDTQKYNLDILQKMRELKPADRPEELNSDEKLDNLIRDNQQLTIEAINLLQETTEILKELDSEEYKPKTLITKPFFSGG